MRERISEIRERVRFRGPADTEQIGCVLLVQPEFFPSSHWVPAPRDLPVRTQSDKKYHLDRGEGARVWQECLAVAAGCHGGQYPPSDETGRVERCPRGDSRLLCVWSLRGVPPG